MVCGLVRLQEQISKRHMFKRDWIACSKYGFYYRFDSQHDQVGKSVIYDHQLNTRIFTLMMNEIKRFKRAPKL